MDLKISVLGSTKLGYELSKEEAIIFGGKAAGICYMPKTYNDLSNEPEDKTIARANQALKLGHLSVFGHTSYTLLIEDVPKIVAMVINNEKVYTASEKSARYTQMKLNEREQELYDKWMDIFSKIIVTLYPEMDAMKVKKYAQENARYLISVFTPTTLEYTVSLRQINHIMYWINKFIIEEDCSYFFDIDKGPSYKKVFYELLCMMLAEFVEKLKFLYVPELNDKAKQGRLSFFDSRLYRQSQFGENYCTTYNGSIVQLAQIQRHRTIDYTIKLLDQPSFYIPPMIESVGLVEEWLSDLKSVSNMYPQAMMVSITEKGSYENFIRKTKERLCSDVQLETSQQTWVTLRKYLAETKSDDHDVHNILLDYNYPARCSAKYQCPNPCKWHKSDQLSRLV